ncbi:unnamed protein product [Symbiodinium sp. CCMP2592]|nr:unnamed protein product [Symbiodinium sp. CCMP2592]
MPSTARGVFATSLSPRPDADGTTRLSFLEVEAANGEETMLLEGGGLVANPYLGAITESCDITLQSPRTTTDAVVCSFYRPLYITLLGCFVVAALVTSPFSLKQANPWGLLALFLPKLDQVPPKDEWIADTWDHFKMPQCDSGPMDGAVQKVDYWINESVWVKPRPAKHMPGKWWLFPNESGGGHWVPGHTEPAVPGHYEYKMVLHHKSVPLYRTPQQEACVASRRTANDLHQKLIQQHKDFLKKRAEMEELLQWQEKHHCDAQTANVKYHLRHGGTEMQEPDGAPSGAHCQRACTVKRFAAYTWTKEDGCILKKPRSGTSWQALPQTGAYSGFSCDVEVVASSNWIADEAQKHTLLDGVQPSMDALVGHGSPGTVLCVMLLTPYTASVDVVLMQQRTNSGIFKCDRHAIYSNQKLRLATGLTTRRIHDSQLVEIGGQWNTALDTDLALSFWRAVLKDPEWKQVKWIVQTSPETVFNFGMLKSVLFKEEQQSGLDTKGTYLAAPGTIGFPPFFQVLSQTALKSFGLMSRECFWQMRYWGNEQWPQSMWMDKCLMDTVHARRPVLNDLIGNATGAGACLSPHWTSSIAHHPVALREQRVCFEHGGDEFTHQKLKK